MNRQRVARAYEIIAEGYAELSRAYADEQPVAGAVSPAAPAPASIQDVVRMTGGTPEPEPRFVPPAPRPDGLERCPVHGVAWVAQPGGISKRTGKPYRAFWKCNEKNEDGSYCDQKPVKPWADYHPAVEAAAPA